jgi:hypothetical protein
LGDRMPTTSRATEQAERLPHDGAPVGVVNDRLAVRSEVDVLEHRREIIEAQGRSDHPSKAAVRAAGG